MKALAKIISRVIVVEAENVDTDQIIPARFLKTTSKDSLGKYLFYNWKNKDTGIVQNKGAAIEHPAAVLSFLISSEQMSFPFPC